MQDVADKKKQMTDDDLLALITDEVNQPVTLWSLLDLQVIPLPLPHIFLLAMTCLHTFLLCLSSESACVSRYSNSCLIWLIRMTVSSAAACMSDF